MRIELSYSVTKLSITIFLHVSTIYVGMKKIGSFFKKIGLAIAGFFKRIWKKFAALSTKAKVLYISLTIICLAIGGFGGYIVSGYVFKNKRNLDDISEDYLMQLEDDGAALLEQFNGANVNSDLTETFSPVQLVDISLEKISKHQYVTSLQYGLVRAMGQNQTVRAASIKNDSGYFLENISAGAVSAARRFYQSNDQVKDIEGKKVSTTSAKWSDDNATTRSIEDHISVWGKDLSRPLPLIISSKTINSGTATKVGDEYRVSLSLHKDRSTIRYAKQMIAISGVENPIFESVDVQFLLDKNLNLIKWHSEENYQVDKIMPGVETYGRLTEYFTYDQQKDIPDLTQNISYKEDGSYEKIF